ncbi:MAPEG family protein [Sphingomonas populi]|uniref:MAPEG family protein n=1 Tax=Sphingomonas populi TaxID=2484750 RepID=A0A4V2DD09_9SPHN|nr:MAPEG family protein [Sphingomonas populi]
MPITLTAVGGAGIINFWLAVRTGLIRRQSGVGIGDGGNVPLIRRMRAHANFVEYAPFVLLLIALIEVSIGSPVWLWAVSSVFLIARIAHALGMDGMPGGREGGTFVTFAVLLGLSVYAVALPFTGGFGHAATETVIRVR